MVNLTAETDLFKIKASFAKKLSRLLETALLKKEYAGYEVNVVIGDNLLLHELNYKYRNKDEPTDVLSFYYGDEAFWPAGEEERALGDIYISCERATAQAAERGHHPEREIALLAIHGLLHLLGFTHTDTEQAELMHQQELLLLKEFDRLSAGDRDDEQGN